MAALAARGVCESFGRRRVLAGWTWTLRRANWSRWSGRTAAGRRPCCESWRVTCGRTRVPSQPAAGRATARRRLRATGAGIVVDGHDLTLVTAGLSAITLITGFVVFAAVRRSLPFDRRLVLSGYRYSALIAAKTTASLAQAVGIGAYAATVMVIFWRPAGIWTIAAAFILGAATYAAFGLLIGVLVRGDLEGFFLIIMISAAPARAQPTAGQRHVTASARYRGSRDPPTGSYRNRSTAPVTPPVPRTRAPRP